jgi:hypothetical protein
MLPLRQGYEGGLQHLHLLVLGSAATGLLPWVSGWQGEQSKNSGWITRVFGYHIRLQKYGSMSYGT